MYMNKITLMVIGLFAILVVGCGRGNTRFVPIVGPICTIEGPMLVCPDGTEYPLPVDGIDGVDGAIGDTGPKGDQGDAGQDGIDGEDGSDGQDGVDGIDGEDGTLVQVVFPCGEDVHDEILLNIDGTFVAYLTSATEGRLVVLEEDLMYQTVGSDSCKFKIESGVLVNYP